MYFRFFYEIDLRNINIREKGFMFEGVCYILIVFNVYVEYVEICFLIYIKYLFEM